MNLFTSLDMIPGDIVSLVGGGGKTTSMFRLAREIPGKYKKLITTTTHIFIPPPEQSPCFVTSDADFAPPALFECMEAGQVPTLGSQRLSNHKLKGLTLEQFDQLLGWGKIDFILNEADGSKRLPLKGHLDHEPVIPAATTLAVILVGADILGQTLDSEHVHRPEIAAELPVKKWDL
jgi:probable selenium-dependent hydroxylase accessory protein YqeC